MKQDDEPFVSIPQITGKRVYYRDQYTDENAYATISAAKASLLLENPFWGFMGLDLVLVEAPSSVIPTLATDGYHIFYSAKLINQLRPGEVTFAVAHEIYHCLFGHTGGEGKVNRRQDGWDATRWNKATDYVINYDLRSSGVGEFITTIQILYDAKFAGMSSEEVYEALGEPDGDPMPNTDTLDVHVEFETEDSSPSGGGDQPSDEGDGGKDGDGDGDDGDQQGTGQGGKLNQGQAGDGNTVKIKISREQAQAEQSRWEQTAQRAVAHIENSSQDAGSIPAHLRRLIANIGKPKIDWRAATRKFVVHVRKLGYSFTRPDKRTFGGGMTLPGYRRDDKKLEIAIAIDTSGSVPETALSKFVSEMLGILKGYSSYEIHAFCFEGDVNEATYKLIKSSNMGNAEADLKSYAKLIQGGGGTMFGSVWDFMREKKIKPRGLVFFTDGYPCDHEWGTKNRTYCPTLFVTVGNHNQWKAPFGMTVAYEDF